MNDKERYQARLIGPIERYDPQNNMFRRAQNDLAWEKRADAFYNPVHVQEKAGYTHLDYALRESAWTFSESYLREPPDASGFPLPDSVKLDTSDPAEVTRKVKWAARFFGASLVGVCKLDRRWLYVRRQTEEHHSQELSADYRYVIALAVEMDYALIQTSPAGGAGAATGLGYSNMAIVASRLAQFIRDLGFNAVPSGNDTALSIPIAIEAGLGELGRNGLLITEKFGPRVRLCKVFTDLPLVPDEPRFFGVEAFCRTCMKCAQDCPSRAISFGEQTTEGPTVSNNPGVLKWFINPEQCFKFWAANHLDCSDCIRVCPFNQQAGWHHDLVRLFVKRVPQLNPLFLWLGEIFGYGKQYEPATIWDR